MSPLGALSGSVPVLVYENQKLEEEITRLRAKLALAIEALRPFAEADEDDTIDAFVRYAAGVYKELTAEHASKIDRN